MSITDLLLLATPLLPLVLAAGCAFLRSGSSIGLLLVLAPLPGLFTAVLVPDAAEFHLPAPFRLTLLIDRPGAILLGGSALLWSAAGAYARATMATDRAMPRFAIWWLLTLSGSLGLFLVADVVSFYLFFTLASLAAYGLIVHEQTPKAERASRIYLSLAVLGEAFLLLAIVMLAAGHPDANPPIRDAVARLATATFRDTIVALFVLGLGLKAGLVPLHVWLPLAHPAAPVPASAVMSGVLVKAGIIGFLRFLPFEAGLPLWGSALTILGLLTAYYGAVVGVTQTRPKTILAYSTVSQMGLVAVLIGVGLNLAEPDLRQLAAYYSVHHTLVKGALFLGLGVLLAADRSQQRLVFPAMAVLALSLGGMPLTSGALAKLATKPMLGYGLLAHAMALAGAGSTLLMLHFLVTAAREAAGEISTRASVAEVAPWLVVIVAALAVPWSLYPAITGESIASLLAPAALWKVTWPMLIGGALALVVRRLSRIAGSIPEGDILVLMQSAARPIATVGMMAESLDRVARRWPVAGLSLIWLVLAFASLIAAR